MKIKKLDDYLISIAIGIRYRANFSIEDQLGKIVDQILYSKNSFFNPKVFPLVQNNVNEKRLINEKTQDYMIINNSNIILEIFLGETFTASDIDEIVDKFEQQIIKGILKEYNITQIVRAGFIKRYVFGIEDLAKTFIDKTIGGTFEGINDINLSFSKKFPVADALREKEIFDYDNVIFNIIKKSDLNELYTSIDYQKYFLPYLNNANKIEFNEFFKKVNEFNDNNYLNWINTNYLIENE
jgi:hypothetical protein